jgi:ABC-2 type transport system permease protein
LRSWATRDCSCPTSRQWRWTMALVSIVALYAAGLSLGVSMPARDWLVMTGLILVGLIPFAALGIALGHLLTPDSIGPAIGGGVSVLALLGGTWFPLGSHGFLHDLAQYLPSYWRVLAVRVYRLDTGRV